MAKKTEVIAETKKTDDILKDLNKKFGQVINDLEYVETYSGPVLKTILSLDLALNGGLKSGSAMELASFAKTGKTTTILTIISQAQKQGFRCFYADVEGRLGKKLLSTIPNLSLTEQDEKDGKGPRLQIICSTPDRILAAEDFLGITSQLLREQKRVLVVVDSLAALCPESVQGSSFSDGVRVGESQKLLYTWFRGFAQHVPVNNNIVIYISHLQVKIGGYGGKPSVYGGAAPEYFSSNTLLSYSTAKPFPEATEPKIGQDITFTVKASALGAPNKQCLIPIRFGRGVDLQEDLVNVAEELGKIDKSGSWYVYEDVKGEEVKLQGKAAMVEYFRQNPDEEKRLGNQIREETNPNLTYAEWK